MSEKLQLLLRVLAMQIAEEAALQLRSEGVYQDNELLSPVKLGEHLDDFVETAAEYLSQAISEARTDYEWTT